MPRLSHILVAGVGNVLRSDDGVGVHAVRELQQSALSGVTCAEIGTAVLHGMHFLEKADRVLVIDAARGGKPPGTVYCFEVSNNTEVQRMCSIHSMGLLEAARFLMTGQPVPPITVIGVQPETLDYGMDLSKPVRTALPRVMALIRQTVSDWQQESLAGEPACLVSA